jgi:hypothetical protein
MSMQSDRDASNTIVQNVGFFAGALARSHAEIEQRDGVISLLRADKVKRDEEVHTARAEGDNLRKEVERLNARVAELESALKHERAANRAKPLG